MGDMVGITWRNWRICRYPMDSCYWGDNWSCLYFGFGFVADNFYQLCYGGSLAWGAYSLDVSDAGVINHEGVYAQG